MGEITWGTASALLAVPLVLVLPGWALLSLLLPPESFATEDRPDGVAWLALAVAGSLVLAPIGFLALHLVGLQIGAGAALAYLGGSAVVVLARRGPAWSAGWRRHTGRRARFAWLDAPLLVLAVAMILVLGVRLWVVRGINVGFWGDSYQHTLITQLLLDNGGLFESWAPYAPLASFTYHFGLHANLALFQWATEWVTGNATPRTVVLVGQVLNALAALALYPLAVRLTTGRRRRWVGVLAVLIAGLLTPMPMFYVNWGRYTQLAGQIILPAAIWCTMEAMETSHRDPRRLLLAALMVAGLAMTHYLVLAFYVTFMIPYLAVWLIGHRGSWQIWRDGLFRLAVIAAVAILLLLPWAIQVVSGFLLRNLAGFVQGAASQEFVEQENRLAPLAEFVPPYLAVLALAGGVWGLVCKRQQQVFLLLLWVGCQFLLSNPHWLRLPGTGVVNNFTVELWLYMPAAILAAYLVVSLGELALAHFDLPRPAIGLCAGALLAAIAWFGLRQQASIIDPQFQLVTPADEQALAWVRQHTPEDARFLVNSFFAYGGYLIVGSDAGWWLPLLGGRQNTVPPLNYGAEAGPDLNYWQQVNVLTQRLETSPLDDPATVRYLRAQGITHLFIGEKGGPLLDTELLKASPHYRQIYPPRRFAPDLTTVPPGASTGPLVFEVVSP